MPDPKNSEKPQQAAKSIEMRVAEIEDKLAKLNITEDEMKAYQKVSSVLGAAAGVAPTGTPSGCIIFQCIIRPQCIIAQCIIRPQCIIYQCIHQCIQQCINECGGGCLPGAGGAGGGAFGTLGS